MASGTQFTVLTATTINSVIDPLTPFGRVRAIDDETRAVIDISSGSNKTLTATLLPQVVCYGIDYSGLTKNLGQAIPAKAMEQLQRLFEDTPLSFLGVYLAPAPNHRNTTWMRKGAAIMAQGWALVPFYFGFQQSDPNRPELKAIDPARAKVQGRTGGDEAAAQAQQMGLPGGSVLWLDMEGAAPLEPSTFDYIDAWRAAVATHGYAAGVYLSAWVAPQMHSHGADIPLWVTRDWIATNITYILDDNLDVGGYCRIVPFGETTPVRRLVQLAKPADADPTGQNSRNWEFAGYPQTRGWQYRFHWTGLNGAIPSWADTGDRQDFPMIIGEVDTNLATGPDPSGTAGSATKTDRRRKVTGVSLNPGKVAGGAKTTITITLNQAVAADADLVVLLRCTVPELIVPTSALVPAGESTVTVEAPAVAAAVDVPGTITARTVHQLSGTIPSADVTVTRAQSSDLRSP